MTGWNDLVIPSDDGIPLEVWYIPAKAGRATNWSFLTTRFQCAARVSLDISVSHGAGMTGSKSILCSNTNI